MPRSMDAQTAFAEVLLERIRRDPHPSYTEMRILEQVVPREMRDDYLGVLIDKVSVGRPSITLLRHIAQLTKVY